MGGKFTQGLPSITAFHSHSIPAASPTIHLFDSSWAVLALGRYCFETGSQASGPSDPTSWVIGMHQKVWFYVILG